MRVLSFPESEAPRTLRDQIRRMQDDAWPPDPGADDGVGHDPALRPRSLVLVDEDSVLACLDLLFKDLVHAGQRYAAGGLSAVVTERNVRGRGHGRRLVSAARETLAALQLDLGLFTCDRRLQAFYESAGWELLPGAVLVGGTRAAPFRSDQPELDKVTMASFFSPAARAARASFEHAAIELFPGEIDRLW